MLTGTHFCIEVGYNIDLHNDNININGSQRNINIKIKINKPLSVLTLIDFD